MPFPAAGLISLGLQTLYCMSFEQISYLAQIIASIGVIVSLIFVGLQIKQNTRALQRTEHNSTMEQWTVIRQAIAQNRDIAELMTAGLDGERTLDAADQLRLEQMLQENAWAAFHIWDRTQHGIFPKGTFEATAGALSGTLLQTPWGGSWWHKAKHVGFHPGSSRTSTPCCQTKPCSRRLRDAARVNGYELSERLVTCALPSRG